MNIFSFSDVQKYLENKQVYFRMELVDSDFKTIAPAQFVSSIGSVSVEEVREDTIGLTLQIGDTETTYYHHGDELSFFAFVRSQFIPVGLLVDHYYQTT